MSLISTSSTTNQEAFLFENHYPQPIVISPNSQICLQKFIHYRGALYEVSTQNNVIGFRIGTGGQNQDVSRFAEIPVGTYEGADLAVAITTALNSVNQQQNYEWLVNFTPAASTTDFDLFQIQYSSVPTPDVNSGLYNSFDSGQLTIGGEGADNATAKIDYNGTNADHFANVISKRSTLVYLGSQTWEMIQPDKTSEEFQPLTFGIVREKISSPNNPNPNLQFNPKLQDMSISFDKKAIKVNYGKQRQGSIVGNPNWFISEVRRDLSGLFDKIFKPGGTFSPHTKLQVILTIYASSQTSRRVLIQFLKKEAGETTYSPLDPATMGNSPISGTPFVKTTLGYQSLVYDSNDGLLNDSGSKINQHFPQLSKAPFLPTCCFQKEGNVVSTGYTLDGDTWTNTAGSVVSTFTSLGANTNGFDWRINTDVGNVLNGTYWKEIDPLNFVIMSSNTPLTDPPTFTAVLDPTAGITNPNGQIIVRDGVGGGVVQTINFDGASPVVEETDAMPIFTQGIFNTIEPVAGISSDEGGEVEAGTAGLLTDLNSNVKMFLRGAGSAANVASLLGFSQNEKDFNNAGAGSGGSIDSDQAPDQTANNNTLHIAIPEMPLVKSYEGENSAEAKSIAIIPREEFSTGDTEGSLVYVAPFENWIDINNGQDLNLNLLTTIVRNADGSLADNLVRETQAIFKIRQDPMKLEEDKKAERFREMAEIMANTINTGLTSLITPQQLIGS